MSEITNLPRLGFLNYVLQTFLLLNRQSGKRIHVALERGPLEENLLIQGRALVTIVSLLCSFSLMLFM